MAYTYKGLASSPIAFGNNNLTQNLFAIVNGVASRVNVIVKHLTVQIDPVTVVSAVAPQYKTSRATLVSGGDTVAKVPYSTALTSDTNVQILAARENCNIIAATPGDTLWQYFMMSRESLAEQLLVFETDQIPIILNKTADQLILRPGQSLLVQVVAADITSNPANSSLHFAQVCWEEESIGTFNISGTVTLGGDNVNGARVIVIEADDVSLTNARLISVQITGVSGTWAATIRTGCIGAAFVQYTDEGTYYTAPGSPFLTP